VSTEVWLYARAATASSTGWTARDAAATTVAVSALIFTVGSFWWMNARRGHLKIVGNPRSFAISLGNGRLMLNVPLAFYNTGPTPVWAINLWLRFDKPGWPDKLPFMATRPGVLPTSGDHRPWATQVALDRRESSVICCEFIGEAPDLRLALGDVAVTVVAVEARSWGRERERTLGVIRLTIGNTVLRSPAPESYLPHDNYGPLARAFQ
jgi:hypothetical protein